MKHEQKYKNYLLTLSNDYYPTSCCLNFQQEEPLKMRLEFTADHFISLGTNKYVLTNSFDDKNNRKRSKLCGKTYDNLLENSYTYSKQEIIKLLHNSNNAYRTTEQNIFKHDIDTEIILEPKGSN